MSTKTRDFLIATGIFVFSLSIRAISLSTFLTTDEPRSWFGWTIEFAQAIFEGRGEETLFSFAPGVSLMWLGSLGLYLAYLITPHQAKSFVEFLYALPFDPIDPGSIVWFRLPVVVAGSLCIAISYSLMKQLLGFKVALLGAFLLALDPLLVGMSRIVGTDGLTASFMLVSSLSIILFFFTPPPRPYSKLALSAIFAGLGFLTKTTVVFMIPLVGLVMIAALAYHKQAKLIWSFIRDGFLWGILVALIIFLAWPVLWFQPVETFQHVASELVDVVDEPHNRGSFFWGEPVPDPNIWFYWIISFFRLTIANTIGLVLAIGYLFERNKTGSSDGIRRKKFILFLLWAFIIFYLVFLSLASKKQDRYITPIIPIVNFLAAAGYIWIIEKWPFKHNQAAIPALVIGVQAVTLWYSAPYYLSHYNLLAGGGRTAANTVLVGWGEGLDLAAGYLNEWPNVEALKVSAWYHSTFEPYFRGQAVERVGDDKLSRSAKPALVSDYVVLYINQIQRQLPTPGMIQYYQSFDPVHVVTINGIDYAFIYPSPAVRHPLYGEVRLVGQAELLGYNLLDELGQPASRLPADATALVQLYWEWQGKAPNDLIGLKLIDFEGREWGYGQSLGSYSPLAFENWAEGAIVRDGFRLHLLPGIPPGAYYLKAWIDRPATGERVGDFPLLLENVKVAITRPTSPPLRSNLSLSKELDLSLIEEKITLLGVSYHDEMLGVWQLGENRDLELYWQANQAVTENYPMILNLVDANDTSRAEWFDLPAGGHFPTDQWQPGDIIRDPRTLTLPPHVPPGDYHLTMRLGKEPMVSLLAVRVEGRSRLFEAPPLALPLDAAFGDAINLRGIRTPAAGHSTLEITPGQPLTFDLVWQATGLVDFDYTVTVQLLDEQGRIYAQQDRMPLDGTAPTTSWAIGEVLVDNFYFDDLSPEIGLGPLHLLIALYRVETGERLNLADGADHLEIPVVVTAGDE
ncbi:MAG: glycosyltransferase family 39 protein [Anaerolineae bacterium]|nr:glycosyltransferase family 39 protein [Anaerolineae bacterium]